MSKSQQQQHRDSKQSNSTRNSNKRSIDEMMMMMEGDDQDDLKTTAATAAVDQTESIHSQDQVQPQDMDTADSVAAAIPSGNDIKDRNEKIVNAINNYVSNLANELGKSKDDLNGIVSPLLNRLKKDEFWKKNKELQREGIEVTTTTLLPFAENADISNALNALMDELRLINESEIIDCEATKKDQDVTINQFAVPYLDPTGQVDQLYNYICRCDKNFKDGLGSEENKYYSPYISICQSSGWGKSRIMRQLSALIPVLYLSYQQINSEGYPRRTKDAIDFLNLVVDKTKTDSEKRLTNESYYRLLFAAQRYQSFWSQKKKLLEGQEHNEGAVNEFLNQVFNNSDFWKFVSGDWKVSGEDFIQNYSSDRQDSTLAVVVFDEARGLLNKEPEDNLFLAIRRSLITAYEKTSVRMFGVFMDTSSKTANFSPSSQYDPSARAYRGSLLFDPYLLPGMKDVRNGNKQDWLQEESVVGQGRPLWTAKLPDGNIEELQEFARRKLIGDSKDIEASYRQDVAAMVCRLGLFLSPAVSIASTLVADHMATVLAYDKHRELMLVSYISEPVLAFGAKKQWNDRKLCPLLKSIRTALFRGIVNEGALGEISAMILLLKSMDVLEAGWGWGEVHEFIEKLAEVVKTFENNEIKEKEICDVICDMIPTDSKLNFTHFIQWFGNFKQSDILFLLKRRAACILPRNQYGADLLIPFFVRDRQEIKFGAILVQVKNCLGASDPRDVGVKLFASYVFRKWSEEELNIPFFRVVLELGLSRARQKPSSIPTKNTAELVEVLVQRDQSTRREDDKATFTVTSSTSGFKIPSTVYQTKSGSVKEGSVKFLRLRGIAGVQWMDEPTYDCFTELLEGPFTAKAMMTMTKDVDSACFWKDLSIFAGLEQSLTDK